MYCAHYSTSVNSCKNIQSQWQQNYPSSKLYARGNWVSFRCAFKCYMCATSLTKIHTSSVTPLYDMGDIPLNIHDDVIKWKRCARCWPFVRGIHRSPVNSPHKGQRWGALMFSLICTWTNSWGNNGDAGDLRHHLADYDVILMIYGFVELCRAVTSISFEGIPWLFTHIFIDLHKWHRDNHVIVPVPVKQYWRTYVYWPTSNQHQTQQWKTVRMILSKPSTKWSTCRC